MLALNFDTMHAHQWQQNLTILDCGIPFAFLANPRTRVSPIPCPLILVHFPFLLSPSCLFLSSVSSFGGIPDNGCTSPLSLDLKHMSSSRVKEGSTNARTRKSKEGKTTSTKSLRAFLPLKVVASLTSLI